MPSAANRQGISHCLESGHPDKIVSEMTYKCRVGRQTLLYHTIVLSCLLSDLHK